MCRCVRDERETVCRSGVYGGRVSVYVVCGHPCVGRFCVEPRYYFITVESQTAIRQHNVATPLGSSQCCIRTHTLFFRKLDKRLPKRDGDGQLKKY